MSSIKWKFPLLNDGLEEGYTNQGIEAFKGEDLIDNLAREICQNSLDAKPEGSTKPVKVEFRLVFLDKNKFDMFSQFEECISGCKEYWKNRMDDKLKIFLSGVDTVLNKNKIPMLIASDYNTFGLTGSKASKNEKSIWRALAHSKGTSVKSADSGGSYGVGKNAPFACSALSMVLYNTYAMDEQKAFQGVAKVATLIQNGNETYGTGTYRVQADKNSHPVYGDDHGCPLRDLFNRTEYGTDVGIVGFNEYNNWEEEVEKAIIKHFFLAIYEEKLLVKVADKEINKSTLCKSFEKYSQRDRNVMIVSEMYDAVINPHNGKAYTKTIFEENDVEFYLKIDDSYKRNIGNFRNTGMLVGRYRKNTLQHFAGVVVIRGKKLGTLLKETEPARHNKWDYKLI